MIEQLIYNGQADANFTVEVGLSRYEFSHSVSCIIFLEAFNMAGVSTRVQASATLDDSPPTPGDVLDGIDVICQGSTQMISVEWTSFIDTETTIFFYQVEPHNDFEQDLSYVGLQLEPVKPR